MATRQYIGARYVPKFYQNSVDGSAQWEPNVVYEPLMYVTLTNGHMYLSRKQVPATVGSPADNIDYWLDVANYNGYISELQAEIDDINNVKIPAVQESIAGKQDATDNNLATTDKTVVGAINEVNTTVQNMGTTLAGKQDATDNNLTTTDKTVVGAINELNSDKQNSTDNALDTTDKTIVGAINELNSDKQNSTDNALDTTDKTIVGAINEVMGMINPVGNTIFEYPEDYGAKGDGTTDDADAIEACCSHARYNGYGVAFKGVTYACSRAIELTGNYIVGVPNRSTLKYTGSARISDSDGAFVTRTGYDRGLTFGIVIDCSNNADIAIDASYGSYGASIQHRFDHVWVEYYDEIGFNCPARAEDYMVNCGTTPTGHAISDGLCAAVFIDYGGPIVIQDSNLTGGYIRLGAQYAQLINCVTTGVHIAESNGYNDISFIGGYCHNDRVNGGNLTVESTSRIRNLTFIGTYIQNDEAGMKSVFGGTGSWDVTQITMIGCHFLDTLTSPTNVNFFASDTPSPSNTGGCAVSLQGCFFPANDVYVRNAPSARWRYDVLNCRNADYLDHLGLLTVFPQFLQMRDKLKVFTSASVSCNASGNTIVTVPFLRNSGVGLFLLYSTDGDYYVGVHSITGGTIGTVTDLATSGTLKARFGGGTTSQTLIVENSGSDVKTATIVMIGITETS